MSTHSRLPYGNAELVLPAQRQELSPMETERITKGALHQMERLLICWIAASGTSRQD